MMKKWLFGAGVFLIAILILFVIVISNAGPLIKNAVNTYGPGITKTDVRLEDATASLFSGEVRLKGFYLGNPKGFRSPEALQAKSIFLDIDKRSLAGDTVIINRIEILQPEITYERGKGRDNLQTIMENVNRSVGAGEPAKGKAEPGGAGTGKKLLIRDVMIKDGKVGLSVSSLGENKIRVPLPDIHLKNIGGDKGGAAPAEAMNEILEGLYAKINSPAVAGQWGEGLKSAAQDFQRQVGIIGKGAREGMEGIASKIKGVFGK